MFRKRWMIRAWTPTTQAALVTEIRDFGFPLKFRTRWAATRAFRAYSHEMLTPVHITYTVERLP